MWKPELDAVLNNPLLKNLKFPMDFITLNSEGKCLLDSFQCEFYNEVRCCVNIFAACLLFPEMQVEHPCSVDPFEKRIRVKINNKGDDLFIFWARRLADNGTPQAFLGFLSLLYSFDEAYFFSRYANNDKETLFTILNSSENFNLNLRKLLKYCYLDFFEESLRVGECIKSNPN
ncbi:MAG: hypothetical protein LBB63_03495 [Holosporaceae bacterium]|nr:hypothetical protein [Holosporaceae bacterium]